MKFTLPRPLSLATQIAFSCFMIYWTIRTISQESVIWGALGVVACVVLISGTIGNIINRDPVD